MSSDKSRDQIWSEWGDLVNMAPAEISDFLDTDASKSVGDSDGPDTTGRASAEEIIAIKQTNRADLSDDQWDHMATVVGYIKRHCSQGGPKADVENSDWRYSLMNWGHDPIKDDGCAA